MAEAFTSIFVGLYFKFFKDSVVFYLIITSLLSIFSLIFGAVSYESPHFLFKERKFVECINHFETMAWVHGYKGDAIPIVEKMKEQRDPDEFEQIETQECEPN